MSIILAFSREINDRVEGLWIGYCISESLYVLVIFYYIYNNIDWDVEMAKLRSELL